MLLNFAGQFLNEFLCLNVSPTHMFAKFTKKLKFVVNLGNFRNFRKMLGDEEEKHFASRPNPVTGKMEWVILSDYSRDIARSAYADMVGDEDRNQRYYSGIRDAVTKIKAQGRKALVLDIGTGSGLLSMMAARAGADEIYACEAFHPMFLTALRVTKANGVDTHIKFIPKHSTKLEVGEGKDLPKKCNILVTETFDTELIGEGCIATYNHALEHLMEPDAISVPTSATVYLELVNSPTIEKFSTLIQQPQQELNLPSEINFSKIQSCPGLPTVHDLQLSRLKPRVDFTTVQDPVEIFYFDLSRQNKSIRSTTVNVEGKEKTYNAGFIYWKLHFTDGGSISCFPSYNNKDYNWREHWIQCAYYIVPELRERKELMISHDEFSYYFGEKEPFWHCQFHRHLSRSRMYQINTIPWSYYDQDFGKEIEQAIVLGDNSLLPFFLKEKKKQLKSIQISGENIFRFKNNNSEGETIEGRKPLLIIGEPSYSESSSCLNDLRFFAHAKNMLDKYSPQSFQILPRKAVVVGIFVKFLHLHKIRQPVNSTCGFDLGEFAKLVREAVHNSDELLETHPLWEYDLQIVDEKIELFDVDADTINNKKEKKLLLDGNKDVNGFVVFCDFDFGPGKIKSCFEKGEFKKGTSQSVMFIRKGEELKFTVRFDKEEGVNIILD